jgi:putative Ca2+/H+ antiporter (TMEM165/GDT1 family)
MWRTFFTVLATVFLAEIGDKTQLSTMLFAAKGETSKWVVFFAASLALVLAAGLGVLVGGMIERLINPRTLKIIAGVGFIVIGIWTVVSK